MKHISYHHFIYALFPVLFIFLDNINEIPLGHKIALKDFKKGDTILKYGHDIGKVIDEIKKGDHVHVHNVKTKKW